MILEIQKWKLTGVTDLVALYTPDKPLKINESKKLIGSHIEYDGKKYLVKGVENYAIADDREYAYFNLLVEEI